MVIKFNNEINIENNMVLDDLITTDKNIKILFNNINDHKLIDDYETYDSNGKIINSTYNLIISILI